MGCLKATYSRADALSVSMRKVGGPVVCLVGRYPDGCWGSFDLSFDLSFERFYIPEFDMSFDRSFAIPFLPMEVRLTKVESGMAATARRNVMRAETFLVCDTGLTQYVRVEPKYVWLTPEFDFTADTDVISNVDWNVT